MSDIVERLKGTGAERQCTTAHDTPGHYLHVVAKISNADGRLMDEAADEITRLRAEVERLKADLATARADALEEAARCAEEVRHPNWSSETGDWCDGTEAAATAIRALKSGQ